MKLKMATINEENLQTDRMTKVREELDLLSQRQGDKINLNKNLDSIKLIQSSEKYLPNEKITVKFTSDKIVALNLR